MNFIKLTLLTLIILLVSSCQKNKKKLSEHTSNWSNVQAWSFSGKMAINDGKSSGSGRIIWELLGNTLHAQFKAPLGQGSWSIKENSKNATLSSSQNGETTADNAELLISNELGWNFPWNSLKFWVRGYQTNQPLSNHDTSPRSFNDNGWKITFQKWTTTSMGMLPKKIKATKDNYSVKLIIYDWNIK